MLQAAENHELCESFWRYFTMRLLGSRIDLLVGIRVLDHVIFSDLRFVSLNERGLM